MTSLKAFQNILVVMGTRLAELREKKGYTTIKEFVKKHDLPEIQYWRIEKGKANITLKTLVRVLSIHGLSLQEFFCLVTEEEHII
jgi:transcriptional regulator with XRE-family HTH domain